MTNELLLQLRARALIQRRKYFWAVVVLSLVSAFACYWFIAADFDDSKEQLNKAQFKIQQIYKKTKGQSPEKIIKAADCASSQSKPDCEEKTQAKVEAHQIAMNQYAHLDYFLNWRGIKYDAERNKFVYNLGKDAPNFLAMQLKAQRNIAIIKAILAPLFLFVVTWLIALLIKACIRYDNICFALVAFKTDEGLKSSLISNGKIFDLVSSLKDR